MRTLPSDRAPVTCGELLRSPRAALRALWQRPADGAAVVIGIALCGMILLCTMENHSRVGRVIFSGVALAFTLLGVAKGWMPWRHSRRFLLPLGAVSVAVLLSCAFSIAPGFSFHEFFQQHLWYILLFAAVGVWSTEPWRQRLYLRGLLVAGIYSSIFGILFYYLADYLQHIGFLEKSSDYVYQAMDEQGREYFRAKGLLLSYTRSAMLFVMAIPASIALAVDASRNGRRKEVVIAIVAAALGVFYILLTKSRGAWLGVGLASLLVCLALRVRWYLPAAAVALVLGVVAVLPSERARALTLADHVTNPNLFLSGRLDLWQQAKRPIFENLWTGIGYGGNIFETKEAVKHGYALISADTPQPDLHQLYLQTLAEVGVIGCAAYLWLVLTLLWAGARTAWRSGSEPWALGGSTAACALLAMMVIGAVYYMNEELIAQLLWATSGLVVGSWARHKPGSLAA